MMRCVLAAGAVALLAGCVTAPPPSSVDPAGRDMGDGTCDAQPAQGHIGQTATAELGTRILQLTRSRTLRWAPPNSALTMDYRMDRVTVSYDERLRINRITCG
ncbi:hypothetical protein EYB45_04615 [Erythrobacteraceae bacterium CFH 75059]|uniref:I78 family peptidase inhibitor n=1 Tax=Qipengyuania thermophila TaxID=2509361 RepID=UPI0010201CB2|nr:I78 family peptidase inhibitor [Qipengyuania thermophila]TCD04834.1 hypothetical protein EYB45_04615 [Erythrobacteraceae bacterium CFH 75059]